VNGAEMAFPLRQQDLADVLGLTQVHVSRMLKLLKDRGVISISDGGITITNMQSLTRIAQSPFD
jgi:CRP-like cAMP-binding protein